MAYEKFCEEKREKIPNQSPKSSQTSSSVANDLCVKFKVKNRVLSRQVLYKKAKFISETNDELY